MKTCNCKVRHTTKEFVENRCQVCEKPVINEPYTIRVQMQDLCSDWQKDEKTGMSMANKVISKSALIQDLMINGLEILDFNYSDFGGCFFIKVEGDYSGKIPFEIVK